MKSQLHRLPQRAALHYPLMQADTFTCMKLSLCNYAGWTFTPQTLSSHCLLKHRPYSTSQCPPELPEQPWPRTSSPTGLTSSPQKLGLFPAGEREILLNCCIKKLAAEFNKIEGAWKANWLMSHMQGSWRPGTAADTLLPSMSNRKALQGRT